MLDLQRQRSSMQNRDNARLARIVLIGHLVIGAGAACIFTFHERFTEALATTAWYLLSIGLIVGMCKFLQWCRISLGLWFILGASVAMVYLAYLPPNLEAIQEPPPPISVKLLPFWLSTVALGYVAGGVTLLVSSRVHRATSKGFALWDVSHNW